MIELKLSEKEISAINKAERDAERGKNVSKKLHTPAEVVQYLESI